MSAFNAQRVKPRDFFGAYEKVIPSGKESPALRPDISVTIGVVRRVNKKGDNHARGYEGEEKSTKASDRWRTCRAYNGSVGACSDVHGGAKKPHCEDLAR